MSMWRRLLDGGPRVSGRPTSSNGASSLHLHWVVDEREPLVGAAATLEIVVPPTVQALHFWALQVTFTDGRSDRGGAHTGLQAHPEHPGGTAVNWGGYADRRDGGGLLRGSTSALPSALRNDNTRDYAWQPKRPYRLTIQRVDGATPEAGTHAWRATVTDLVTEAATVVRDLYVPGDRLRAPVVWSEVFARCDDPTSAVRCTDLAVVTDSGRQVPVERVRTGYQTHQAGGCDNTNSVIDGIGALQLTNTDRHTPAGTVLILPARS